MVDVFIEAFIKDFNNQNKIQNTQRAGTISGIDALNKRYQNALLKNADGEMADDDFQEEIDQGQNREIGETIK